MQLQFFVTTLILCLLPLTLKRFQFTLILMCADIFQMHSWCLASSCCPCFTLVFVVVGVTLEDLMRLVQSIGSLLCPECHVTLSDNQCWRVVKSQVCCWRQIDDTDKKYFCFLRQCCKLRSFVSGGLLYFQSRSVSFTCQSSYHAQSPWKTKSSMGNLAGWNLETAPKLSWNKL